MNPARRALLSALSTLAAAGPGAGLARAAVGMQTSTVWRVQPGDSLAEVLRSAEDGDVVELAAGFHDGQVGVITQRRLTVRGLGGRAVLRAAGRDAEGKALLVVRSHPDDSDIRFEDLEFRGARVPDLNGAGVRFERGRLTVRRCAFFDNQMGILTANFGDAELTVEDSEFGEAPAGSRLPHLLYAGHIARLTLRGSRFSGGQAGHLVKSRARENHILYNRLVDGPGGRAAYELEFPNGGLARVVGNLIGQSRETTNRVLLSFGAEGSDDRREQGLFMAHNTLINEGPRAAVFVRVSELPQPVARRFVNNLLVGAGRGDPALADPAQGNFGAPPGALLPDGRLPAQSPLRGRGVAPGAAFGAVSGTVSGTPSGWSLVPQAEFALPVGTRPLAAPPRWSPGAYQSV